MSFLCKFCNAKLTFRTNPNVNKGTCIQMKLECQYTAVNTVISLQEIYELSNDISETDITHWYNVVSTATLALILLIALSHA